MQNEGNKPYPARKMQEKTVPSPVPFYGVGLLWLVYGLLFPLYRVGDFLIAAALSVALYLLLQKLLPGKTVLVPVEETPLTSGDRQADALLAEGQEYVKQLKQLNEAIDNEQISRELDNIVQTTRKIFEFIARNPGKAPQIRKFMEYYRPTLLKLLEHYDVLEEQGVEGENIAASKRRIEQMMGTISAAFVKQLDGLFGDQTLDISTDITVLQNMLAQEGLTGPEMK